MEKMMTWKQLDEIGRQAFAYATETARAAGIPYYYRQEGDAFITRVNPDGSTAKIMLDENGREYQVD